MNFREYQDNALQTRQKPKQESPGLVVPLLGLAGELGELASEYKKSLRDGNAHRLFEERIAEELGDILWYLTDATDLFGYDLETIAKLNLEKCRKRWGVVTEWTPLFDADCPEDQRLPRRCEVTLSSVVENGKNKMRMSIDGDPLGDSLTDNAYEEDGYRFHDIFHLACAAMLGWSPVTRKLMNRKRKDSPMTDEVEDGGRATAIEEGVSALVFSYAKDHNFLEGITSLDHDLLRSVRGIVRGFEVEACTTREWERTILQAYSVWREIKKNGGGTVNLDQYQRTITII